MFAAGKAFRPSSLLFSIRSLRDCSPPYSMAKHLEPSLAVAKARKPCCYDRKASCGGREERQGCLCCNSDVKKYCTDTVFSYQRCLDVWFPSGSLPPRSGESGTQTLVWMHTCCWSSSQPREMRSAYPLWNHLFNNTVLVSVLCKMKIKFNLTYINSSGIKELD